MESSTAPTVDWHIARIDKDVDDILSRLQGIDSRLEVLAGLESDAARRILGLSEREGKLSQRVNELECRIEVLEKRPTGGEVHTHYHTYPAPSPLAPFVQPFPGGGSPSWPNHPVPWCGSSNGAIAFQNTAEEQHAASRQNSALHEAYLSGTAAVFAQAAQVADSILKS